MLSSSYSTTKSGSDAIINVGSGSIRIKSIGSKKLNITGGKKGSTISSGKSIYNTTKNKTINGTSANDTISNTAGGVKIYASDGNDSIYSSVLSSNTIKSSYGYVTIDGGAGNDTIYSVDPYVSINGGAGNDTINTNGFSNITIKGGAGNDTINLSSIYSIIQYSSGDGNDIINGYASTDTINISGSYYSTQASGSDVIIKVGSGKMTLKNARYETLNIKTSSRYFIEEHWFTEDKNFTSTSKDDLNSILNDSSSDYKLISTDYKFSIEDKFTQGNKIPSVTQNQTNKK